MGEVLVRNTGGEPIEIAGVELAAGGAVTVPADRLDATELREVAELVAVYPVAVVDERGDLVLPPPEVAAAYGLEVSTTPARKSRVRATGEGGE